MPLRSQFYFVFYTRRLVCALAVVLLRSEPFWQFGCFILSSMTVSRNCYLGGGLYLARLSLPSEMQDYS